MAEQSMKHYPGYFRGKRVRIITDGPNVYTGLLQEFQQYCGKVFLVLEAHGTQFIINLDHIVSIEEKDQQ